jgi:TRAP-type transport system small permease protein
MKIARFTIRYFEELVGGTFMVLMSLTTFSNVIARYLFNNSIQWAEEFSRYSFIWVVFMGAVVCTKHRRHIAIDSIVHVLPVAIQAVLRVIIDLVILGLMVTMVYYGMVLVSSATQPTSTMNVPQYVVYFAVPFSAFLVLLYTLGDLRRSLGILVRRGR